MNHSLKSIAPLVFFVIFFFCCLFPANGESLRFFDSYGFSLSGNIGFLYGNSYEIVYKGKSSKDYLSELQWDIKPLIYLGINLDYGLKNPMDNHGFFAGLGLKIAIPTETGIMEDRDWMPYVENYPKALTHFSSHENHTKAAVLINLNTGYSIPVRKFALKFFMNFDYMYYSFEARNGYTRYGVNSPMNPENPLTWFKPEYKPFDPKDLDKFPKNPVYGLCISYSQHWILFNTGIGTEFPLGQFTISTGFFIGPSICIAVDNHHFGNKIFTDIMYKGIAIKPTLSVFFTFSDNFDIGLSAAYHYISDTRGNTQKKENGVVTGIYNNQAGAAFKAFEGNVLIRYRFYKKIIG